VALVLIGFMGAGKSRLAARLAERRGSTPLDSDALLAERFGHPVAHEFDLHGEASFRAAEERLVCDLLGTAGARDVIALGGGSVLSERVRHALRGHVTAFVDVEAEVAWARVGAGGQASERPLARDRDAFLALHSERAPLYEELADAVLLWAQSASGEYPVLVGRGLLRAEHDRLAALWPLDRERSRPFCVSDRSVAPLYASRLGELAALVTIAPGEEHKTLATAEHIWRELARRGMRRGDHVVALGGGVVGDLAGFCAATYQRGVRVVHVPTTLVAQVDSAYGGKTGVDLPDAKNYVGVYHQPSGVLADPDTLATLPARERAAGWVEALKTALIAGGPLWETLSAGREVGEREIVGCARTKLAIVAGDERDAGRRQVLNLGHTLGHAIEAATGFRRYLHGEAVGLGLLAALSLSGQADLRAHVRELLVAHDLPVSLHGVSPDDVLAAAAFDKKRTGAAAGEADGLPPFVLVRAPGQVEHGRRVAPAEVRRALAELAADASVAKRPRGVASGERSGRAQARR
jgi:shikimate kinase/3-dehydroquinate synthase